MVDLTFFKECLHLTCFRQFRRENSQKQPLVKQTFQYFIPKVTIVKNSLYVCASSCGPWEIHIKLYFTWMRIMSNHKAALGSCHGSGSSVLSQLLTFSQLFSSFGVVMCFTLTMIHRDLLHPTENGKTVLKFGLEGKVQMTSVQSSTAHHYLCLSQWEPRYHT